MTDDLTGDLDLLGDWLDARGYGEEAGLCTRVMDHMHKQDARIAALEATLDNILSCHRNAMIDPRLFSALIPDYVLEEAYGVLKKKWMKETPE